MKYVSGIFPACILAIAVASLAAGCEAESASVKQALIAKGFSEPVAGGLSALDLGQKEVEHLGIAREQGFDEKLLLAMVESLHDKGQDFLIGPEMRLFKGQGMTGETIAALSEMGAIPAWADDARALKDAGIAEAAIIDIARVKYVDSRPVLAGIDLVPLKTVGISDAGLVRFVEKGGDLGKREVVARNIALGRPEAEALGEAGL